MLKPKKPIQQTQTGKLNQNQDSEQEPEPEQQPKAKPSLKKKAAAPHSQKDALAAAFDAVPMSQNAKSLPPGQYEAIIRRLVIQQPDSKGQSARIEYELCDPDFQGANVVTGWFKLLESDLKTPGGGMKPFKLALAKLGYEPESLEEAEAVLEEISENNPGIIIKISYDDAYPDYPRTRIETESDSKVITDYKDNVVY